MKMALVGWSAASAFAPLEPSPATRPRHLLGLGPRAPESPHLQAAKPAPGHREMTASGPGVVSVTPYANELQDVPLGQLPRVVGHRGAKGAAPENTLASIVAAKHQGCTWVEVDVMLTADKVPVIHHDNTLDRCTNGRGNLWELTVEELEGLDAGSHFSAAFAGEKVPRLTELIACCRELDIRLNLEVKHVTECASAPPTEREAAMEMELAEVVCNVIEHLGVQPQDLVFSSFSRVCIGVLRRRLPSFGCAFLVEEIPNDWAHFVDANSCVSLNLDHTRNSREQVAACRRARPDIPLFCYTVNDGQRAVELLSWGVSGVFSDVPGLCQASILQAAMPRELPMDMDKPLMFHQRECIVGAVANN